MVRYYNYCCKNCFHMWKKKSKDSSTLKEKSACPKCKSVDIDIDSELKET